MRDAVNDPIRPEQAIPAAPAVPVAPAVPTAPSVAGAAPPPDVATGGRRGGGIGRLLLAAILGGTIGAAAVGAAFLGLGAFGRPAASAPKTPDAPKAAPAAVAGASAQPIESAAAKVLPSVVNIAVEKSDGFSRARGNGSGVILRADGYVLTNNHVVERASSVQVRIGTQDLPARIVGTDPSSDLAVLKIDRKGLVPAEIGRSNSLTVGQTVIAVGSPFGLDKTVTSGIVSALHRSNLSESASGLSAYTNLIQTDAAINPGNSGGALVDLAGRVVGINTLIQSPAGQLGTPQSAGIGFAIPIDYATSIADQIIAGKKVEHPFLGVSMITVDAAFAEQYGLAVSKGALVQDVSPASPAEKAGLKAGDIIVRLADQPVTGFEDAFSAIRGAGIGATVPVELVRDGKTVTLTATLGSDRAR